MNKKRSLLILSSDVKFLVSHFINFVPSKKMFNITYSESHGGINLEKCDLVIMLNYGKIIAMSDNEWEKCNLVNFHTGLPHQRGSNPWFYSVWKGSLGGVTVHKVDSNKIDCGDIYDYAIIEPIHGETGKGFRNRLASLMLVVAKDFIEKYVSNGFCLPDPMNSLIWSGEARKVSDMKKMFDVTHLKSEIKMLLAGSSDEYLNFFYREEGRGVKVYFKVVTQKVEYEV